ncbi:hypothetical protein [Nocardia brasiliensis]|uniref:hypothetical protein n=1 Tax=Nocardia brasiliensis TaxID=37326 RepID=UPI003671039A
MTRTQTTAKEEHAVDDFGQGRVPDTDARGNGAPTPTPVEQPSDAAIEAEYDACTRRLGIEVPADLKGGILRGYRGLRDMAAALRDVPVESTRERKEMPNG